MHFIKKMHKNAHGPIVTFGHTPTKIAILVTLCSWTAQTKPKTEQAINMKLYEKRIKVKKFSYLMPGFRFSTHSQINYSHETYNSKVCSRIRSFTSVFINTKRGIKYVLLFGQFTKHVDRSGQKWHKCS